MSNLSLKLSALALVVAFAVPALAQEKPADPQEPDETTEAPAPLNWFDVGVAGWKNIGSSHKFQQYAIAPNGVIIRDFGYVKPMSATSPYMLLRARGILGSEANGSARFLFDHGRASLSVDLVRDEFFDPTPILVGRSRIEESDVVASYAFSPKWTAYGAAIGRRRNLSYEPPQDRNLDRNKTFIGGVQGLVGTANVGLNVSDSRWFPRGDNQPDAIRHHVDGRVGLEAGPNVSLEATGSWTQIEQRHTFDSEVKRWGLRSLISLGDATTLGLNFGRETIHTPNVESAYVRERFTSGAQLAHHFGDSLLRLGAKHVEAERLRDDHAFVDVPKWNVLDGSLTGKLGDVARFGLKSSWTHYKRGALMQTEDPRQLYWDDRVRAQVRLDGGFRDVEWYANYGFAFDQNSPRGVEIRSHLFTLGAAKPLTAQANGYFEFQSDTYQVKGGVDETGLALDSFFPSGVSFAGGVDWGLNDGSTVNLRLNHFFTRNANPVLARDGNVRSTQLTLSLEKALKGGRRFEFTVAPWTYKDRLVDQMNYRSLVISATYFTKF